MEGMGDHIGNGGKSLKKTSTSVEILMKDNCCAFKALQQEAFHRTVLLVTNSLVPFSSYPH